MEDFATRYALVPAGEYEELKKRTAAPPYNPLTDPLVRSVKRQRAEFQADASLPVTGDYDRVLEHAQKLERYLDDVRKAKRNRPPPTETPRGLLPPAAPPAPEPQTRDEAGRFVRTVSDEEATGRRRRTRSPFPSLSPRRTRSRAPAKPGLKSARPPPARALDEKTSVRKGGKGRGGKKWVRFED